MKMFIIIKTVIFFFINLIGKDERIQASSNAADNTGNCGDR